MGEEREAIEVSIKGNWLTCLNKLYKKIIKTMAI